MRRHRWLLYIFFALTLAQRIPRNDESRYLTLSASSPITNAVSHPPRRVPATELVTLLQTLSSTIDARIASNDSQACNLRAVSWITLQLDDLEARNIGALDRTCQSRLYLSDAVAREQLPAHFFATARTTLRAGAEALATAVSGFARGEPLLAWRSAHAVTGWDVMKGFQSCSLETATAYRLDGEWYVRAVATNHPVDAFQPDWDRLYVEEFIRAGFGRALRSEHPNAEGVLENGTTLLVQRAGKASFSSVSMGDAENPALVEALRLNRLAVDQAADAITPSNIAILALPMVMSLIPVAFVADLNTCGTLLYIAFTDIFSTLPFLIKGIELTATGVVNRGELVVYHTGTKALGVMEVWAAECHGDDSFRSLGIIFICVAVGVMVMGISFEICAWKWMKLHGKFGKGPFGEVLMLNRYTVLERTGDEFDGEEVVNRGTTRWRIRWTGFERNRVKVDHDFEEPEYDRISYE